IQGWILDSEADFRYLADQLERLAAQAMQRDGTAADPAAQPFLYAVGDGNHSLATAKAVWEEYKQLHQQDPNLMEHPARYALVELENIYDEGIDFEPIHRILFGVRSDEIIELLGSLPSMKWTPVSDPSSLLALVKKSEAPELRYGLLSRDACTLITCNFKGIATAPLQPLLDRFLTEHRGAVSIDYIHGDTETANLALAGSDRVGIILPPVGKDDLFITVGRSGPLPRKSFSMGEGVEKRYYLECRRLFV
ncbi:MAG: DUF1015 family protein, partial [Termitinemataceae bacterium]